MIVIIGAGILGLHIAARLLESDKQVIVLDAARYLAEHTSGRNSGVVHAGIFYQAGSFKETVCIEGNRLSYEWLERLHVPYRRSGKWVVPEEGQEEEVEPFFERIRRLPIPAPRLVEKDHLAAEEPFLRPSRAVFVPSTGVLDAASYVKSLAAYLEGKGVPVILNCQVTEIGNGKLQTTRGEIDFDVCINAAGLFADEMAKMSGLIGYEVRPCRGDYYLLQTQPVTRPVYHLPYLGAPGLGVHLTPTVDGQTLLGPNAFFIAGKTDYEHRSDPGAYEAAVRFYLPSLKNFRITQAYSGNRPKLYRNGQPVNEFVIERRGDVIHLLGIESPGMTAAPVLARHVANLI